MKQNRLLSTAIWNVPEDKVEAQLNRSLKISWIIAILSFFAFGFIAIASLAFGARCIFLSWRKVVADKPNGVWLKVSSIAVTLLSLVEYVLYQNTISHL